jgi:hypothetical protein
MAEATTHAVRSTRLSSPFFEHHGGGRIESERIRRETLPVMAAVFQRSALAFNDLESTSYKSASFRRGDISGDDLPQLFELIRRVTDTYPPPS